MSTYNKLKSLTNMRTMFEELSLSCTWDSLTNIPSILELVKVMTVQLQTETLHGGDFLIKLCLQGIKRDLAQQLLPSIRRRELATEQ